MDSSLRNMGQSCSSQKSTQIHYIGGTRPTYPDKDNRKGSHANSNDVIAIDQQEKTANNNDVIKNGVLKTKKKKDVKTRDENEKQKNHVIKDGAHNAKAHRNGAILKKDDGKKHRHEKGETALDLALTKTDARLEKREQLIDFKYKHIVALFHEKCDSQDVVPYERIPSIMVCLDDMSDDRKYELMEENMDGLSYETFLDIILECQEHFYDEMMAAFKSFDRGAKGHISLDDLKVILLNLGESLDDGEIKKMMTEADTDCDGVLNFKEFLSVMNAH